MHRATEIRERDGGGFWGQESFPHTPGVYIALRTAFGTRLRPAHEGDQITDRHQARGIGKLSPEFVFKVHDENDEVE